MKLSRTHQDDELKVVCVIFCVCRIRYPISRIIQPGDQKCDEAKTGCENILREKKFVAAEEEEKISQKYFKRSFVDAFVQVVFSA